MNIKSSLICRLKLIKNKHKQIFEHNYIAILIIIIIEDAIDIIIINSL